jgi:predicted proteasome-type protease
MSGRRDHVFDDGITPDDAYFRKLSDTWTRSLDEAHQAIPPPPYGDGRA